MAKNNNVSDFLQDIAEELKIQRGEYSDINAQDFTTIIRTAKSKQFKDVNFIDYDGAILYSYSWDEFRQLDTMPPVPDGPHGIPLSWNYSSKERVLQEKNKCIIGLVADIKDEKSIFVIKVSDNQLVSMWSSAVKDVDWGDGTVTKGVNQHVYQNKGYYTIVTNSDIKCDRKTQFLYGGTLLEAYYANNMFGEYGGYTKAKRVILPRETTLTPEESNKLCEYSDNMTGCLAISSRMVGEHAFFECNIDYVSLFVIEGYALRLSKYAFAFCDKIHTIVIPENTIDILYGAFEGCTSLKKVYFPSELEGINYTAFARCNIDLMDFSVSTYIPNLIDGKLWGVEECTIVVPDNLYDDWIVARNWSNHANQIVKASEYTE